MDFLPENIRAWIYRVILAAQPLVVFYGIATDEEVALWIALIAAALGTALAAINTSTKKEVQ